MTSLHCEKTSIDKLQKCLHYWQQQVWYWQSKLAQSHKMELKLRALRFIKFSNKQREKIEKQLSEMN